MYCRHCGKLVEGGRFCSTCGGAIAPGAVDAVASKLKRQRNEMLLVVAALGLIMIVAAGLIVSRVLPATKGAGAPPPADSISTSAAPQPTVLAPTPATNQNLPIQPQEQPRQAVVSEENSPAIRASTRNINPKDVENALTALTQNGKQSERSVQPLPPPSAEPSGSDHYPGSQAVEVKDANLPDIGVPIATEVYTTADSVLTVVTYYTQRYSDAEVMEVNGQKIIAVNRPGATKVIAIGTTGQETRIAIVRQAN